MKKLFLFLTVFLVVALASPANASNRMPTPEICGDGSDNDNNGAVDDGCPVSPTFAVITSGLAADAANARKAGTITTSMSSESSSGTYLKNGGNYKQGQWALDGIVSGTRYPWAKIRVQATGNPTDNRLWLSEAPFTIASQNEAMTIVSETAIPPPPSFSWFKLNGNFTLSGAFTLYSINSPRVEIDCIALVESDSTDIEVAQPECPDQATTEIAFDAAGNGNAGAGVLSLSWPHTVGIGADRILIAAITHRTTSNTISSVSSNVDGALTLLSWDASASGNNVACALYYKSSPTSGAHTLTVNFSESQNAAANSVSYAGISQTSPFSSVSTTNGTGNPSHQMESNLDARALGHLCASVDTVETVTSAAGQTERFQEDAGISGGANRINSFADKQGDATVQLDWTISGTKVWIVQGVSLNPPSGAVAVPNLGPPVPTCTSVGATSATCESSIDDTSSQVFAKYDTQSPVRDVGSGGSETEPTGTTGGKAVVTMSGLSQSTQYFYHICGTNDEGTGCSSEGTFDTGSAACVTGLCISQAEIDIWNTRLTNGPYKSTGDVSTNSPGDWDRINANANSFRAGSATAETWTGQPSGSCWSPSGSPAKPGRTRGETIRDTAFRYLLTGDANDLNHVLTALLDQAAQAGTDWSDSTRWNTNTGCMTGDGHSWEISAWLRKLLYAYDYIRHAISSGNRTTLDTWFKNAGDLFEENVHKTVISRFPNRLADDYSSSPFTTCSSARLTHFGGHTYCSFHEAWSNRSASHVLMFGLVGLMQNDATLKDRAARWYREWLRFHVFADNTDAEFHRWTDTHPGLGWNYAGVLIAEMATLADWFARAGDTSLILYETSDGFGIFTPAGGPKTLLGTVLLHVRHVNISVERYGTDQAGRNGDPNYRIDSVDQLANESRIHDTYMAPANVFFNNAEIKSIYLRQASGAPAYPSTIASGGYCAYCGEWGTLPGILFMFGQMEGTVSPYPEP